VLCGDERSCEACVKTARCEYCTARGRCGPCRNIHSKARRAAGFVSVHVRGRGGEPLVQPVCEGTSVAALDVPRSRGSLDAYYRQLTTVVAGLSCAGGSRWLFDEGSSSLQLSTIEAKDQYETPAWVWRFAVRTYALDRDAHASSLNAVLPLYDSPSAPGPVPGSRYWLNPAYGGHCRAIGDVLARYVWQQGCAVVALLPALVHLSWWHDFVMRADAIHYLRTKLSFANPFLDVTGAYFYSFVLVAWEPTPAQTPPRWTPLEPPATAEDAERLRVRRCIVCATPPHSSQGTRASGTPMGSPLGTSSASPNSTFGCWLSGDRPMRVSRS